MRLLPVLVSVAMLLPFTSRAGEFGVYEGAGWTGQKELARFSAWFGRPPRRVLDFLDFSGWQAMVREAGWAIPAWKGVKLTLSVPLTVKGTLLSEVADGMHDGSFAEIARLLVANGQADAIVRLGWEANGGWYPWAAAPSPKDYIAAFRRAVAAMRAVPGARFRYDWTTAQGWQQIIQPSFYPGDDVVDIIGQDLYAQTWNGPVTWQQVESDLNRNYTLDWLPVFANAHGKPISIPEWGTGERPDAHGLGDSAAFVDYIVKWGDAHNVAYMDYWDYPAPDYDAKVSDGRHPQAGAALRAALGRPVR